MRRILMALMLGVAIGTSSGCIVPAYSGDPAWRVEELIWSSENLRMMREEWQRIWFLDQPDHMSPWRTHGGLI
jgi:hypothetical protein